MRLDVNIFTVDLAAFAFHSFIDQFREESELTDIGAFRKCRRTNLLY